MTLNLLKYLSKEDYQDKNFSKHFSVLQRELHKIAPYLSTVGGSQSLRHVHMRWNVYNILPRVNHPWRQQASLVSVEKTV